MGLHIHREAEKNEPLFFYNQLYSSKNFDSSINKEKNTKKKDTRSQHTETHIQQHKWQVAR